MEERMRILERIEAGEISAGEGARQIEALLAGSAETETAGRREASSSPAPPLGMRRWLWHGALWSGTALIVGGGLLIAGVYAWSIPSGWQICGWSLLALGVLGIMLSWWMQQAHWLSLRVREHDGRGVSLALPLPLGPLAWALRIASPFVPQLRETGVDELILSISEELRNGQPVIIEVNDEEDGEQVQVHIG